MRGSSIVHQEGENDVGELERKKGDGEDGDTCKNPAPRTQEGSIH